MCDLSKVAKTILEYSPEEDFDETEYLEFGQIWTKRRFSLYDIIEAQVSIKKGCSLSVPQILTAKDWKSSHL